MLYGKSKTFSSRYAYFNKEKKKTSFKIAENLVASPHPISKQRYCFNSFAQTINAFNGKTVATIFLQLLWFATENHSE